MQLYDVIFVEQPGRESVLAQRVPRSAAAGVACSEARRLRAGRMFLAGSRRIPGTVLIVDAR